MRAEYLKYDRQRAMQHFGVPNLTVPENYPPNTLMVSPVDRITILKAVLNCGTNTLKLQRCLTVVRESYPEEKFITTLTNCFETMWLKAQQIDNPEVIIAALSQTLSEAEVKKVMESIGQQEWKAKLTQTTKEALDRGAYGAPWFWLTNDQGHEEPFFGSDRFNYMWRFLGLEWEDMKLVDPSSKL